MADGSGTGEREGRRRRTGQGEDVARRFELLLDRFRRVDGEPWRHVEISRETNRRVSSSYISALRRGELGEPGEEKLSLIADVMGFPPKLFHLDPERWDEELARDPRRRAFRDLGPADPSPPGLPQKPAGDALKRRVDYLFENRPNPETGSPYSEEEVAERSGGRVTVEEIRKMRAGEQYDPPAEVQLIGLSEAFDVPLSTFYGDDDGPVVYDVEGLMRLHREGRALIRHRQQELSPAERNMLDLLFQALESNRKEAIRPGTERETEREIEGGTGG